jgi:hypothetical protein
VETCWLVRADCMRDVKLDQALFLVISSVDLLLLRTLAVPRSPLLLYVSRLLDHFHLTWGFLPRTCQHNLVFICFFRRFLIWQKREFIFKWAFFSRWISPSTREPAYGLFIVRHHHHLHSFLPVLVRSSMSLDQLLRWILRFAWS